MLPLFKFLVCAFFIFFAGSRLSKYGDIIAKKTGLGHAWIGIVLLAAITSLPELFNGISAVVLVGEPDLAVGNILGACLINLAVIGGIDLFQFTRKKEFIFLRLGKSNQLSVLFGIFLTLIFALGVMLTKVLFDFTIFGIGFYSLVIFILYLVAQRVIFVYEKNKDQNNKEQASNNKNPYFKFSFFALIVIVAGTWLPYIGDEMAISYGLGKSFIGVFFLGIATTLPELVVSTTALKYSVNMSIGNLLGSNIFNLSLLFIDDILYQPHSIFKGISFGQFTISLFLLISFILVVLALKSKKSNRLASLGLILSYLVGIYSLFILK